MPRSLLGSCLCRCCLCACVFVEEGLWVMGGKGGGLVAGSFPCTFLDKMWQVGGGGWQKRA